jgi:hypothetical protein
MVYVKLLILCVLVKIFYCTDIYVSVGGNTNGDCGTSLSNACSDFSTAFNKKFGTTFGMFFFSFGHFECRNTFYFGAGYFEMSTTYYLHSHLFTYYEGAVDSNYVPATALNLSSTANGFFYNSDGNMSLKNFNITNQNGQVYYGSFTNYLNLTNIITQRGPGANVTYYLYDGGYAFILSLLFFLDSLFFF